FFHTPLTRLEAPTTPWNAVWRSSVVPCDRLRFLSLAPPHKPTTTTSPQTSPHLVKGQDTFLFRFSPKMALRVVVKAAPPSPAPSQGREWGGAARSIWPGSQQEPPPEQPE